MSDAHGRRPSLVLGIGNILLRDEGVGVRVIEQMQKMHLPDDVELVDGGTAGAGATVNVSYCNIIGGRESLLCRIHTQVWSTGGPEILTLIPAL